MDPGTKLELSRLAECCVLQIKQMAMQGEQQGQTKITEHFHKRAKSDCQEEGVMIVDEPAAGEDDEALRPALSASLQTAQTHLSSNAHTFGPIGPPRESWTGDHDNPHACFFCRHAPRIGNEPKAFQCTICKTHYDPIDGPDASVRCQKCKWIHPCMQCTMVHNDGIFYPTDRTHLDSLLKTEGVPSKVLDGPAW